MKRVLLLALATLVVPTVPVASFGAGEDDAGSGTDAPSTPWKGLVLPGWGSYTGEIRGDSDWYEIRESRADFVCVQLDVAGEARWETTLGILRSDGVRAEVYGHLSSSNTDVTSALVTSSLAETAFAIAPDPILKSSLEPGFYAFALQAYSLADLAAEPDAGTGDDAGVLRATASEVLPGCFGGSVSSDVTGMDRRDVFAFVADAGEWVTLAFGASRSTVNAVVLRPDGSEEETLSAGDAIGFEVMEGGTWHLAVDAPAAMRLSGPTDTVGDILYGFGLSRDGRPPGQSCRPTCV